MCKFCEQDAKGLFKPMAVNNIGFKIPLVEITLMDDSDQKVLQVNFDESEPLQLAINYCPICGSRISPPSNLCLEDQTFSPNKIALYSVQIGEKPDGTPVTVAIPNPNENYVLFYKQIKEIATGKFSDMAIPWCIQKLYMLLKKDIPLLKFVYSQEREVIGIDDLNNAHTFIATVDFVHLPIVESNNKVWFNQPVSWKCFTDENYKYLASVLKYIAEGHLQLPNVVTPQTDKA